MDRDGGADGHALPGDGQRTAPPHRCVHGGGTASGRGAEGAAEGRGVSERTRRTGGAAQKLTRACSLALLLLMGAGALWALERLAHDLEVVLVDVDGAQLGRAQPGVRLVRLGQRDVPGEG